MIVEIIAEKEPGALVIRATLTHVAALLQKGQAIAHILNKYLRETDAWFIFDEINMIPSQLMGHIARWKLMGNKIILIGYFKGQFLPVYDRWGDSADIATSKLLHTLCNRPHINLTVYRRGTDPELFAFYYDKLHHTDLEADLRECVQDV